MWQTLLVVCALCTVLFRPPSARAYSVLTHEQLIDLTWDQSIVPLLLSRYPNLTPAEIEQARAYAYGGCVIQDIGYYPLGDAFFSNLTHYVRSGDFVVNLFRNASTPDELAFAVGALSHYINDTVGRSTAWTNDLSHSRLVARPSHNTGQRRRYTTAGYAGHHSTAWTNDSSHSRLVARPSHNMGQRPVT